MRLEAAKQGFVRGCRPILFVDRCHLKGAFRGLILGVMAKDENDDMFPATTRIIRAG